jgi:hypothetical protein
MAVWRGSGQLLVVRYECVLVTHQYLCAHAGCDHRRADHQLELQDQDQFRPEQG